MGETVNFDFGAADRLAEVLNTAAGRVHALISYRKSQHDRLLGAHPCDNWAGPKRTEFDGEFGREQRELIRLEDELRSAIKGLARVNSVAEEAYRQSMKMGGPK